MTVKGVDISVIQGDVDFVQLASTGVEFCIIRCGVGNGGKDSMYDKNVAKAKAAGIKVMAYNFIYPLPTTPEQPLRDPKAQAKLHADWTAGELVACDLEWPEPQNFAKWGCTAQQIIEWSITYLQEYERLTGIRPVVYTYPSYAHALNLPESFGSDYKLWIASYGSSPVIPKPWTDWVLWQNSNNGKLANGCTVDTDIAKDLSLWNNINPVVAAPPVVEKFAPIVFSPITVSAKVVTEPVLPVTPDVTKNQSPDIADTIASVWQAISNLFNKSSK